MATEMLTPVPTDTPLAMATIPPDPFATQAAQMVDSSTPAPEPTVTQATTPQVITSPTPTQVQTLSATSQPTLERYYYHANRLYSVAALTDAQGNVIERYQYNAYGLCTTFNANYELPLTFSRFGNPFTFTGRELDAETDLMDYRTRQYSPRQGRFVSTDTIGYEGGVNLYEYVSSKPSRYCDPSGLAPSAPNPTWRDAPNVNGPDAPNPIYDKNMSDETWNRYRYHQDCADGARTDCAPEPKGGHQQAADHWKGEHDKHENNYNENKGGGGGSWISDYYDLRVTKDDCCKLTQYVAEKNCRDQITKRGFKFAGQSAGTQVGAVLTVIGVVGDVTGPVVLRAHPIAGAGIMIVGGGATIAGVYLMSAPGISAAAVNAANLFCNCDKIIQ